MKSQLFVLIGLNIKTLHRLFDIVSPIAKSPVVRDRNDIVGVLSPDHIDTCDKERMIVVVRSEHWKFLLCSDVPTHERPRESSSDHNGRLERMEYACCHF